jgi:hypothetical protein
MWKDDCPANFTQLRGAPHLTLDFKAVENSPPFTDSNAANKTYDTKLLCGGFQHKRSMHMHKDLASLYHGHLALKEAPSVSKCRMVYECGLPAWQARQKLTKT